MSSNATDLLDAFARFRREIGLLRASMLAESGLGQLQATILYRLTQSNASMSELADYTLSDPAAITRAIATMKKSGWVERSANPNDSRSSIVTLTARGRAKAAIAKKVRERLSLQVQDSLTAKERTELARLLEKAASVTRKQREE
jgi:DNA-binding MarR family transcriptional regulator